MSDVLSHDDLSERAIAGADNLLNNCVNPQPGETVLIVTEDADLNYFDSRAPAVVEDRARARGANVLSMKTQRIKGPDHVPNVIRAAVAEADHTIFFNRIGDQMRFRGLPGTGSVTMMYALDVESLASDFCTLPHDFMSEFGRLLQAELDANPDWRITCPLGTDIRGRSEPVGQGTAKDDFRVSLFPVTVFRPVPATHMDGKVVLSRWVNSTNTHVYDNEVLRLEQAVTAHIKAGRICDLEGPQDVVAGLEAHMDRVADELGIDSRSVHSWHAGINPRTKYFRKAQSDPARWGGMMFASPRYLHFHTCGDYAPGEICWHVLDATVTFGNNTIWNEGRLEVLRIPGVPELLEAHGMTPEALETIMDIGL